MAKNLPENGVSWQEREVLGIGLELLQQISIHKFVVWTIWTQHQSLFIYIPKIFHLETKICNNWARHFGNHKHP